MSPEVTAGNAGAPRASDRVVAFGMALLGLFLALYAVIGSLGHFGAVNDLPEYYAAAKMAVSGNAGGIYRLADLFRVQHEFFPLMGARGVGLFLPPFAVPLLLPLALLPAAAAPVVWAAFLFAILIASALLLAREFKLGSIGICWLIGLLMLSGPAIEALRIGQLAPILLFALVMFVWLERKESWLWSGVALAVLVLKPQQLLPLLVYLFGARRYKMLAAAIGFMALNALVSFGLFGADGYSTYTVLVRDPHNLPYMQPELTPTIRGQFMRLFGIDSAIPNAVAAGGLLASSLLIWLLGRRHARFTHWTEIGLAAALPLGLLCSFHCHDYDLLLLAPGMVALFLGRWSLWCKVLNALLLVGLMDPIYAEVHYGYLIKGGAINPYFVLLAAVAVCNFYCGWTRGQTLPPGTGETPGFAPAQTE